MTRRKNIFADNWHARTATEVPAAVAPVDGKHYWINCPGVDDANPLMIGRFRSGTLRSSYPRGSWDIIGVKGVGITHGPDIRVVRAIPTPRGG